MMDQAPITPSLLEMALGRPADPIERACLIRGLRAFLREDRPQEGLIDTLLASLAADLARQLDTIFHHPRFQALESAWRGLWLVVSRMDRGQNVRCEVLNCSKEDLLLDFEDSPEVPKSGLYRTIYSGEYGPFGGRPYTAILADYEMGPADLRLLRWCAEAVAPAWTPFIVGSSPVLVEEGPTEHAARWQAYRESDPARYVGLVFPRVLARAPHRGETIRGPEDRLWQTGVYALAVCLVRSFEICRLPCNITGPVDGLVEDLPTWSGPRGDWASPAPVEAWLSGAREAEIAARGVIPLGVDVGSGEACFHTAPTCLAKGPEDSSMEDRALHRELPIVLLAARFAQTLKVLHREQIGTWLEREALLEGLRAALDGWTHRPTLEGARPRKPLRRAEIRIYEPKPWSGFRPFDLRIEPNWSLDGRFFTVAIDGKLDME